MQPALRKMGSPPEAISAPENWKSSRMYFTALLPTIFRGLVDKAHSHSVTDIDVRRSIVEADVVGVRWRVATIEGAVGAAYLAASVAFAQV